MTDALPDLPARVTNPTGPDVLARIFRDTEDARTPVEPKGDVSTWCPVGAAELAERPGRAR